MFHARFLFFIFLLCSVISAGAQDIPPAPGKYDCILDFFGKESSHEQFQKWLDRLSGNDDDLVYRSGYEIAVMSAGFYSVTNKKYQLREMTFTNAMKLNGKEMGSFKDSLPFGLQLDMNLLKVSQTLGRPIEIKETSKGLTYYYFFDGIKVEILFSSRRENNNAKISFIKLLLHPQSQYYEGFRAQGCAGVQKREPAKKSEADSIMTEMEEMVATRPYFNHIYLSNILNVRDRYELYVSDRIKYQLRGSSEMKSGKLKSISTQRIIVEVDTMRPQQFQKIIPHVPNANAMIYGGLAAMAGGAFLIVNSFSANNNSALQANLKLAVGLIAVPSGYVIFKKGRRYRTVNSIDFDKNWRMEIRSLR